jgi:hypothetical protein
MAGRDKKRPPIYTLVSALTSEPIMQRLQRTISTAELLALSDTPIQLLPAPGVGKYYLPWLYLLQYHAGTTPFTLGTAANFLFLNMGGTFFLTDTFLTELATLVSKIKALALPLLAADFENMDNYPLLLTNDNANLTDGDGSVTVTLYYTTETFV